MKNSFDGNRIRKARYNHGLSDKGLRQINLLIPYEAHSRMRDLAGLLREYSVHEAFDLACDRAIDAIRSEADQAILAAENRALKAEVELQRLRSISVWSLIAERVFRHQKN